MLIVGFLWVTYNSIRQGAAPYYFKWYFGKETMVGVFFIGVIIASMVSSFIATPLTNFFGKRRLFILVMVVSGLLTCGIYFVPQNNIPMFFVLGILAELAAGIMPILFFAMLGDTADYSEYTYGRRATGLTFSAGTFAMKFGGGMAGVAMMLILKIQGYLGQGVAEQSKEALVGIRLINSFVPVVFIILAILIILLYPLSTDKMKEIETELKSRQEKEE
jgi:GPH family glycoside/pentoside/hexuronide:cation symporter